MGKTEGRVMHDDPKHSKVKSTGHPSVSHQAGDMGEKASMAKGLGNLGGGNKDLTGHKRLGKYKS